jgi:hypothetical protein
MAGRAPEKLIRELDRKLGLGRKLSGILTLKRKKYCLGTLSKKRG